MKTSPNKRVALVHDWLTGMRGGERCLEEFLKVYPDADIFTLLHIPGKTSDLIDSRVKQSSFLQKIPFIKNLYRWFLPLYPFAIRSLNVQSYDLVISLSHAAAKNVKPGVSGKHICYCFTPMRYIWDQPERYFGRLRFVIWPIIKLLRKWDLNGARSVDGFVAISKFVSARIKLFYSRDSSIIFPPINDFWLEEVNGECSITLPDEYYLYAGALVSYKNVKEIVQAFNSTGKTLVVAGTGPELNYLKSIATKNTTFTGRISDQDLRHVYKNAKALIFAAKEDFGLIPIESLALGSPVIGPYCGALKESLDNQKYWHNVKVSNPTGVYFKYKLSKLPFEINQAIQYFETDQNQYAVNNCRQHAKKFTSANFKEEWFEYLETVGLG